MSFKKLASSFLIGAGFLAIVYLAGFQPIGAQANPEEERKPVISQVPFGVNNPFDYTETDTSGESCIKSKSVLKTTSSYSENHIEASDLEKCLPVAAGYMNNIKDIGINVISRYFTREYDKGGMFNFESGRGVKWRFSCLLNGLEIIFGRDKPRVFKRICWRHKHRNA